MDDFAFLEDRIIMAEAALKASPGRVTVTDLNGRVKERVDLWFAASSIAARRNTIFGDAAVMVTSFFDGGLYSITID